MRILLMEDDSLLGEGIKEGLIQEGHTVDWMLDGVTGQSALETEPFDVCILDLGLPRKSGLEVLRSIRQKKIDVKVIILTAQDKPTDKVLGLDTGADDYLAKPFDMSELYARLRALQRRSLGRSDNIIKHERYNLILDQSNHSLTINNQPILLPRKEFAVLQKLLENMGKVVTKDTLEQSLYNWDDTVDSNTLEVHIHYLRKKLGSEIIRTIRGSYSQILCM